MNENRPNALKKIERVQSFKKADGELASSRTTLLKCAYGKIGHTIFNEAIHTTYKARELPNGFTQLRVWEAVRELASARELANDLFLRSNALMASRPQARELPNSFTQLRIWDVVRELAGSRTTPSRAYMRRRPVDGNVFKKVGCRAVYTRELPNDSPNAHLSNPNAHLDSSNAKSSASSRAREQRLRIV